MESDERFKHLVSDPRFKILRKKRRQVQIDDRFKSMFTDKRFTLQYTKDKRGQKQSKTSGDDLKKYYALEEVPKSEETKRKQLKDHNEEDTDEDKGVESNVEETDDEKVEDDDNETDSKASSESDISSSSSEESESEDEDDEIEELEINKIRYDWQPLDADAEKAEKTTRRLAIQNLDWDRLDVKDLYTLVNSVRRPMSVKIYVSEFGKERLKKEELEGPREIVEMDQVDDVEEEYNMLKEKMENLQNPKPKSQRINEYEDADEELNIKNEEVRERVRRYQISRMKYYYAVVDFDSVESAELVYKELDGLEYEGSSLELDLRFIPDDITFDNEDLKAECNEMPDLTTYKVPQFISSALQQTTVQFTWDQTDLKRQERLHRAFTKEELEKDDLEAYLASETDTDEDEDGYGVEGNVNDAVSVVTANSEARVNKYKDLLKSLEEESNKKKKNDVDVEWGNFSEEEEQLEKVAGEESESSESSEITDVEEEEEEDGDEDEEEEEDGEEEEDNEEELPAKSRTQLRKENSKRKRKVHRVEEKDEELDLLVMDVDKRESHFKFDPEDSRFQAIYNSGLYNIDPSHPNFKRTQAFDLMAEKKREKRQK